jgi:hypothetical protein
VNTNRCPAALFQVNEGNIASLLELTRVIDFAQPGVMDPIPRTSGPDCGKPEAQKPVKKIEVEGG